MTKYGERYEDLAELLTGHGYVVAVNDVIGHVKSIIPGEEPVYIDKWKHAVKDFEICRRSAWERFRGSSILYAGIFHFAVLLDRTCQRDLGRDICRHRNDISFSAEDCKSLCKTYWKEKRDEL